MQISIQAKSPFVNNLKTLKSNTALTPSGEKDFKTEGYEQPPFEDLFRPGGGPKFGTEYNKYISSTQVPHHIESAKAYYDEAADKKMASEFYSDLDGLSGAARMDKLGDLLAQSHEPNPKGYHYVIAKHLYTTVDKHPDGTIRSIYNREPIKIAKYPDISLDTLEDNDLKSIAGAMSSSPEVIASWLAFQRGNAELNCEHVVPQSKFGKAEPMRSDLHHLFACDIGENSRRGATRYGRFKPKGGRGEVARATLYFMARYPNINLGYNGKGIEMLKDWSAQDPPSLREKHRNHEIQKLQGNRNPFIDHPEWLNDFRP